MKKAVGKSGRLIKSIIRKKPTTKKGRLIGTSAGMRRAKRVVAKQRGAKAVLGRRLKTSMKRKG